MALRGRPPGSGKKAPADDAKRLGDDVTVAELIGATNEEPPPPLKDGAGEPDELVKVYAPKAFRAIQDNSTHIHIVKGFHPDPIKRSTAEHPYSRAMGLRIVGEDDDPAGDFVPAATPTVPQDFDGSFQLTGVAPPDGWEPRPWMLPIQLQYQGGKVRGMRLVPGAKFGIEVVKGDGGKIEYELTPLEDGDA
jgi:hypothetical protein